MNKCHLIDVTHGTDVMQHFCQGDRVSFSNMAQHGLFYHKHMSDDERESLIYTSSKKMKFGLKI